MRGATAPRLILELICGRILLPMGDSSEAGLLARIERLERVESIAPQPRAAAPAANAPAADPADYISPVTAEAKREVPTKAAKAKEEVVAAVVKEEKAPAAPERRIDSMDVAGLRRLWPDVTFFDFRIYFYCVANLELSYVGLALACIDLIHDIHISIPPFFFFSPCLSDPA
jgi:DNA polymerase-3 subunit gamma/tau